MASGRMIRRETKRIYQSDRLAEQRTALRRKLRDATLDMDAKLEIHAHFKKLKRDSSRIRRSRRCVLTGRARGVYRHTGLCRNEFRRLAMQGELPGMVKASW